MNDISLRMMQLGADGYCCSQILVRLALEAHGEDNPALVRAAAGLCRGMGAGNCSGTCGALAGGNCVLALYAARGTDDEQEHERFPLMIAELAEWFAAEIGASCGGVRCCDILGREECGQPDASICGPVVERTFGRCMEILMKNGMDPASPPKD